MLPVSHPLPAAAFGPPRHSLEGWSPSSRRSPWGRSSPAVGSREKKRRGKREEGREEMREMVWREDIK